ncbi:MAG: hypothetical protein ACUZ8E_17645 [Candidatus Anammoxibacter sp.]
MINELDEITPEDLYYGRMVRDLLRKNGTITIHYHDVETNTVRFSFDKGDWAKRSCLAKSIKEINTLQSVLSIAEYDAENIVKENENDTTK